MIGHHKLSFHSCSHIKISSFGLKSENQDSYICFRNHIHAPKVDLEKQCLSLSCKNECFRNENIFFIHSGGNMSTK